MASLWSRVPWWALLLIAVVLTAIVYVWSDNAEPTLGVVWYVSFVLVLFGLRWAGQRSQK